MTASSQFNDDFPFILEMVGHWKPLFVTQKVRKMGAYEHLPTRSPSSDNHGMTLSFLFRGADQGPTTAEWNWQCLCGEQVDLVISYIMLLHRIYMLVSPGDMGW